MKISGLIVGVVLGFVSAICGADELPYRLAGIIIPTDGEWLALIESPDGKQRVYRKQDSIGDGRIIEVSRKAVKIKYPDREYLLQLRGGGFQGLTQNTEETPPRVANRELNKTTIEKLSKLLSHNYKGKEQQLITEINSLLGLPEEAWIVGVDDKAMTSPADGLNAMLKSLNKGELPRLTISGVSDLHEVYVIPIEAKP